MVKRLLPCIGVLLLLIATAVLVPSRAQTVKTDHTPIRPMIPLADRDDESRVFLENANELQSRRNEDFQVLIGDVQIRRGGMRMYCDSAYFYDKTGSFDAFSNVRMEQGDTLFIYAEKLIYNDSLQLASLYAYIDEEQQFNNPGKVVRMINRNVTLTTDIFYYDLYEELGYYNTGGKLTDDKNVLTSVTGEYLPNTKDALFTDDVHLFSPSENDTVEIFTDHLLYNTDTHIAELTQPSTIISRDGTIETTRGIYKSDTKESELYDRSLVTSKNGNTLTGDSLFYNQADGIGFAYGNIEICDTTNKMILQGDFGFYYEALDSAMVTGRARAIEYSQGDSLYLHGDTIRAYRIINLPPQAPEESSEAARADEQQPAEEQPEGQPEEEIAIETIEETLTEPADEARATLDEPVEPEQLDEETGEPLEDGDEPLEDGVEPLEDRVEPLENGIERTDEDGREPVVEGVPEAPKPEVKTEPDTIRYIVAAPRVKFYRKDMQGLCDSLTFVSVDTMLYMNYSPILWSDNRQVTGDLIQIHLNDSTIDWAKLPTNSFMAEEIEEGYYNQLAGKEMIAKFDNGELRHLDVNGNVLAITFPEESDSTINKVANIESSFMSADFRNNTIEKMVMWPQTNATVTPLYLAKRSLFFLQAFKWHAQYRPDSPDDIFEFSDELIDMLNAARKAVGAPVYLKKADEPEPTAEEPSDESEAQTVAQPAAETAAESRDAAAEDIPAEAALPEPESATEPETTPEPEPESTPASEPETPNE